MASVKKENKLTLLLELLSKGRTSLDEICERCDSNRSNAYNLLNELKKRGYDVRKEVDNRRVSYYLKDEVETYEHISKEGLFKFAILNALGHRKNYKKSELLKYFEENSNLDVKKSRLYDLCNELKKDGDIVIRDGKILLTGNRYNGYLTIDDIGDYYDIAYLIDRGIADDNRAKLDSIKQKLSHIRQDDYLDKLLKKLRELDDNSFRRNVVRLSYTTKNSGVKQVLIGTGIVVYCVQRGSASLLGYGYSEDKGEFIKDYMQIIPLDAIAAIESTKIRNPFYKGSEFKKQYDDMFFVSSEKPQEVKVVFHDIKDEEFLTDLASKRNEAALIKDGDDITFSDSLCGISDFSKYISEYMENVEVIGPKKLIADRQQNAAKALKRYEESANEK